MSLTILLEPKSPSCFEKQDSISVQSFELAQTLNFENDIDSLASYSFLEIELENEYDHKPQLSDSILLLDSIMTPVSSPDLNLFPESTLDPMPIHYEIESPIFYDHHILNLTSFILLKVPLTNWQVLIFMLNSMRNVT